MFKQIRGLLGVILILLLLLFIPKTVSPHPIIYYIQNVSKGKEVICSNFLICISIFLYFVFGFLICSVLLFLNKWQKLTFLEAISLGISGSPIFISLVIFFVGTIRDYFILISIAPSLFLIFRLQKMARLKKCQIKSYCSSHFFLEPSFTGSQISIVLFFIMLLYLVFTKFAYIYGLEFPLNSDSVNHTYMIKSILLADNFLKFPYYHYAFHYIVISLTSMNGADIAKNILIIGQFFQAMAPITLFYPVYTVTKNIKASFITIIIAGFVWSLPSQATSWGKYPALMAFITVVFVFYSLENFLKQIRLSKSHFLYLMMIFVTATFIHSRMVILIIIEAIVLFTMPYIKKRVINDNSKLFILISSYCIIFIVSIALLLDCFESWSLAFLPYSKELLVLLVILLPFSYIHFFEQTIKLEMFFFLCLLFALIPVPRLSEMYNVGPLIDRPFLSMILFIPFSITPGLIYAGIEKFLANRLKVNNNILLVVLVCIIITFPNKKVSEPLPNVNFVTPNDLHLYDGIIERIPKDAKVLIPSDSPYYELGVDGGAWITYATDRETVKVSYSIDLTSPQTLKYICNSGARYIYLGSKPYSFSLETIVQKKDWYTPIISYYDVQLYKIIGCSYNGWISQEL